MLDAVAGRRVRRDDQAKSPVAVNMNATQRFQAAVAWSGRTART
jgi:hypothetical protein